jgi:hypothetical protein
MMPTREDPFIKLFLSAYDGGSWADAKLEKPDAIDRTNPAVDQLATRKSDSRTLAIEHTIVEPFVGDKEDFASFAPAFLEIENDESLKVAGRFIQIFVPVGALRKQPPAVRTAIVQAVHSWIKANRLTIPEGRGIYRCLVTTRGGKPAFDIALNVKVTPLKRGEVDEPGIVHVRRQQIEVNLGDVIEKVLRSKIPKLVNTNADSHVLLLERQHMNLFPESMLEEFEKRRAEFPALADVDEIWIIETPFYETPFGGTYLRFELYDRNGDVVRSYDFNEGKLIGESEDSMPKFMSN